MKATDINADIAALLAKLNGAASRVAEADAAQEVADVLKSIDASLADIAEAMAQPDKDDAQLASAIEKGFKKLAESTDVADLTKALKSLKIGSSDAPSAPPVVNVAAPNVTVQPPSVSFESKAWTEISVRPVRDSSGDVVSYTIKRIK